MEITRAQQVELLRASCCIAGADGETTEGEFELLKQMAHKLGVGSASLDAMIDRAESDQEFYQQQFGILKENPLECLDYLIRVVVANGQIKESEFTVLRGLANKLDVSQGEFETRVTDAVEELKRPG